MRILNSELNTPIDNVGIYLTRDEAKQLRDYLEQLLEEPELHHIHVNDENYEYEITVSVYDQNNLESFDERSRKLIQEGI